MWMIRKTVLGVGLTLAAGLVLAQSPTSQAPKSKKARLHLQSDSFKDGGMIPVKYTCAGDNVSPELNWKDAPPKTKFFALIVDDPDAPTQTWVHWVVFNIPAKKLDFTNDKYELVEGFPRDEKTREGIMQGMNDFKKIGYDGPCPPSGTHRYYFKLYALDGPVNLPAGISKYQLLKAIGKHTLAWTQIMGLYGK
jgi:Raf kinase inhibitor-like YbhB/YbcL family protein